MTEMFWTKAISLHQPYAGLVEAGIKTLETRTWSTAYRGDLMICSTVRRPLQVSPNYLLEMPLGVTLCMVTVTDVRRMTRRDEKAACIELYPGAWVWQLENLRPVRHVPMRGYQQIYNLKVPTNIFDLAA